jgi:aminoglycoside phosphotransferase (APT) family kinase protein
MSLQTLGHDRSMPAPPLRAACAAVGLDPDGAELLHHRANAVYHVEDAVVRLRQTHDSPEWQRRLESAVRVTTWLAEQGYPTVRPLPVEQPQTIDGWTITYWRHVVVGSCAEEADAGEVGTLLRELHALPGPPVPLVATNPLGAFPVDLQVFGDVLPGEQRAWLQDQGTQIAAAYDEINSGADVPLGYGMIHGDAHGGNLMLVDGQYVVGDWDSVSRGPRVQDLVPTLDAVRHFGRPSSDWAELCATYGVSTDLAEHPVVKLLMRARELRSLAAYLRASARPDVRSELDKRLQTLMTGKQTKPWHAV